MPCSCPQPPHPSTIDGWARQETTDENENNDNADCYRSRRRHRRNRIGRRKFFGHRDGRGLDFLDEGQFEETGLEIFDTIDADGDGALTQAEIDKLLNDRHAAHDANADGNLDLEEFAGLWNETMHPLIVRAFQMLDTDDDGIVTRAEYDRPFAGIVEWLDRDGSLSKREGWDDDDDDDDRGRWWDDD